MKQSNFLCIEKLCSGSDMVRRDWFKTIGLWDSYALLARVNHSLAADFAPPRGKSALFEENDCFECLSPHRIAA